MSLRRSARNVAQPAVSKVSGAPKENGIATHATSVIDANGNGVRDAEYPAPSPELQAKRGARKIGTAMVDTKVTKKKTVTPKKTSAPVKRKAPVTESEASTGIITNVANSRETPASTGAPPELINQIQPETPASIDVANPIETFTIPNDTLTDADFAAPGTQHGRVPTPDMPRGAEEGLSLPSTPVSKKRRKTKTDGVSPAKTVPFTPTPSGVGLIAGPENIARKPKNRAKTKNADHMLDGLASINRPAAPDVTNAPVLTSNGSQVVINDSPARKRKAADLPPDVGSPHKPANSTIETLLKDAEAYLVKVDETEKLAKLIENQRCKLFSPEGLSEAVDPFTALASGIMGQQVSGAAAASIRKKFTALFSDTHPAFPSPSAVLTKDIPTLRTAGLSQRKAEYITGLAEKFASGEFTAEGLVSASDEELIEKLVAVRGLGRWSVEMFACFGLKRMDVFSTGDLGVQRGMAAYMGRDVSKLKNKGGKWKYMSEQEMLSIASKFSPYRSLFMWYMWRIADVETEVLE